MKKYQLFSGESKESASGIGGIIMIDDTFLAIVHPPFAPHSISKKRYFVNFENLSGKLTEILEYAEVKIPPFDLMIEPCVYIVKFE